MPYPLNDQKINSKSWLTMMTIGDYLKMVNLEGNPFQRGVLPKKNYKKLIEDLLKGTVIPPVSVVYESKIENFENSLDDKVGFKILDGLQRTNCLYECINSLENGIVDTIYHNVDEFKNALIYVEIWEKMELRQILYKMLVLNTGQKKMDYKHQLDILGDKLTSFLTDRGVDVKKYYETASSESAISLSTITESLVSYMVRSPMPSRSNAVEYLFERFESNIEDGSVDIIMNILDQDETYNNIIFILKDLNLLFDQSYGDYNPLKKYDVFMVATFAAFGNAYEKKPEVLKEKIGKLSLPGEFANIFNKDAFETYYHKFKAGIGHKRRKFIFEAMRSYLVNTNLDRIEWQEAYDMV